MLDKLKSRKLWVTLLAIALNALNRKLGLDLTENEIMSLSGVAGLYVAGQGWVDGKMNGETVRKLARLALRGARRKGRVK